MLHLKVLLKQFSQIRRFHRTLRPGFRRRQTRRLYLLELILKVELGFLR